MFCDSASQLAVAATMMLISTSAPTESSDDHASMLMSRSSDSGKMMNAAQMTITISLLAPSHPHDTNTRGIVSPMMIK